MTTQRGNGVYTTFRCFEGVATMKCVFRANVVGNTSCRYYKDIGGECQCREAIKDALNTILKEIEVY